MAYMVKTILELADEVPAAPFGAAADVLSVALTNLEQQGWELVNIAEESGETHYFFHKTFAEE